MTTIERAKRYWRRIARWAVMTGAYGQKWDCQARVARALIRQDMKKSNFFDVSTLSDDFKNGYLLGMNRAISILDAVYGREKP